MNTSKPRFKVLLACAAIAALIIVTALTGSVGLCVTVSVAAVCYAVP
jgi:hypothetical protein